jgi:hypothetical protein
MADIPALVLHAVSEVTDEEGWSVIPLRVLAHPAHAMVPTPSSWP